MKEVIKPIHIMHIITRLDAGGAAENVLYSSIGSLKKGDKVTLISGYTENPAEELINKARETGIKIEFVNSLVREISPSKDINAFLKCIKLVLQYKPDIVHTHSSKGGIIGRWAAKFAGTKRIIHTPHGHIFYGYYSSTKTKIFIEIEKATSIITEKIITLTDQEAMDHLDLGIGKPGQFTTVHSGVEINEYKLPEEKIQKLKEDMNIPTGTFVIGSAGRLAEVKGHKHLLAALAETEVQDIHLLLAGEGELKNNLVELSKKLDISDKVTFLGWQNLPEWLPVCDVFVLPSLNEGMGRVLIESLAMGIPIIASAVGGVPEVLGDGSYGTLVPPASPYHLKKALEEIAYSENLRIKFIKRGPKRSLDFNIAKMVDKLHNIYHNLS